MRGGRDGVSVGRVCGDDGKGVCSGMYAFMGVCAGPVGERRGGKEASPKGKTGLDGTSVPSPSG